MSNRQLLVLPDDGVQPLVRAIDAAKEHLAIKMFLFSDPDLMQAVIAAHRRGVAVQVMLNPHRHNGTVENEATYMELEAAGIAVKDTHPSFRVTHEKTMIIDRKAAFIHSLNWEGRNLAGSRDYAIMTTNPQEVQEVLLCFQSDWLREDFRTANESSLIWCTGNGRERIANFIDNSKHSLFIQNDRIQDLVIIERLVRAAHRGVKVHVMARPAHSLKKEKLVEGVGGLRILHDVGIRVHDINHMRLHGKLLLADGCRAIVGSINLSPGSFDERRELAIEVDDRHVLERLEKTAHHDWKHSYPLDLTDAGLLKDLEMRSREEIALLALQPKGKKPL